MVRKPETSQAQHGFWLTKCQNYGNVILIEIKFINAIGHYTMIFYKFQGISFTYIHINTHNYTSQTSFRVRS
jgi:hypothetical protein